MFLRLFPSLCSVHIKCNGYTVRSRAIWTMTQLLSYCLYTSLPSIRNEAIKISFNLRSNLKIWHLGVRFCSNFMQSTSIFSGSKVLEQTVIIVNLSIVLNTWMKILCNHLLPEVWSP